MEDGNNFKKKKKADGPGSEEEELGREGNTFGFEQFFTTYEINIFWNLFIYLLEEFIMLRRCYRFYGAWHIVGFDKYLLNERRVNSNYSMKE